MTTTGKRKARKRLDDLSRLNERIQSERDTAALVRQARLFRRILRSWRRIMTAAD